MLTLFILFILAFGFYTGTRRGFMLQLLYTFGYLIVYIIARANYQKLAPKLELLIPYPSANMDSQFVFFPQEIGLELDQAFYAGVSFLLILFVGWLVIRLLGVFVHKLTFLPLLKQFNGLAGGVVNFLVIYVGIVLVLYILSVVPVDSVQNLFRSSSLARFMVEHTPIFSKQIYNWWIQSMI